MEALALALRGRLRDVRYGLPSRLGRLMPAPGATDVARWCRRLHRRGIAATPGYFQDGSEVPDGIAAAYGALSRLLAGRGLDTYLSVKAPPLGFDPARLGAIAGAASAAGLGVMLDAHAPGDAEPTLLAAERLLAAGHQTGIVLPARWRRSLGDGERLRGTPARIRVVKGEWADGGETSAEIAARYLDLVANLAGRTAPVAVATHCPTLAGKALRLLLDAGTPCELEQLRALPRRRTGEVARRLGVRMRVYLPFGPGWWPYAIDKALARPYLPAWWARDVLGIADPDEPGRLAGEPAIS